MEAQEIFNKTTDHLRLQQKRATNKYGEPMYLNDDGLMCSVGCLLSSDELIRSPSGNVAHMLKTALDSTKTDLGPHLELLNDLQVLHDKGDPTVWEQMLKQVALKYNLTFTPKEIVSLL